MKLGEDVLVQIIEAVRKGLSESKDISDLLRNLEVEPDKATGKIVVSTRQPDEL